MRLIMTGVASTCTRPLPTRGAVCSSPTRSSDDPFIPVFSASVVLMPPSFDSFPGHIAPVRKTRGVTLEYEAYPQARPFPLEENRGRRIPRDQLHGRGLPRLRHPPNHQRRRIHLP